MNNSMEWIWFKVPVKVEQIYENLLSDTESSQKGAVNDVKVNDCENDYEMK